jgi:hypothetical protein
MPLVLVKEYVVDSSIPKSWTYTRGRTIAWRNNLPTSQLLMCCCVNLNIESLFTLLPQWNVGQLLAFAGLTTFYV